MPTTTYPIHTKPLTRSTSRPVSRLAVGAAVHGSVPGPVTVYDRDARDYFARLRAVDGSWLEVDVEHAVNDFVIWAKDTPAPTMPSHWDAICAGQMILGSVARTPAGAAVPLYGGGPPVTSYGIVTGDYDRVLGIQYDGATKYIDLGVRSGDLPRDDVSQGVHITAEASSGIRAMIGYGGTGITGSTRIARHSSVSTTAATRSRSATANNATGRMSVGLVATSRVRDDEYDIFGGGGISTLSSTSQSPATGWPVLVGASGTADGAIDHSDHRSTVAWHCQALDLAAMDDALTALHLAIQEALS